tara:strand:+ start:102 stop:869 length:768 start_codon:yes stop_codon:yes gene_type:complete
MNTVEDVKKHIINKIASSPLISEPFDHKFVENIFPDNFYNDLLINIPNKKNYVAINKTGRVSSAYSPERFVFNLLDKKELDTIEENKKLFLQDLLKTLLSNDLFSSVTSQFSKTIDYRLANLSETEKETLGESNYKFFIKTSLVKDFTKYSLGAHTDVLTKFVTFLFYIPENDDLKNVGTALYEPINNINSDNHQTKEDTSKNFKKIKTCPFIPNSLLVFPRTNNSFHGVEEVNIEKKERNLMQLNYFFDIRNQQ